MSNILLVLVVMAGAYAVTGEPIPADAARVFGILAVAAALVDAVRALSWSAKK